MKQKIKVWIRCFVFLCIFLLLFIGTGEILHRKTKSGAWNFSIKTGGFYNLEEDSIDVLAVGSSHCYCTVNPLIWWEKEGFTGYVLSSQQQPVSASYYYMKEALKYQKPQVVIYECYMACLDYQNPEEGIVRDACEYLRWSADKVRLIQELVPRGERIEYYIDYLKYHTRWKELTVDDYDFSYRNQIDDYRGYVFLNENKPQILQNYKETEEVTKIPENNRFYLEKMVELSKEFGFELIFLYAPFAGSEQTAADVRSCRNFAEENQLKFIDGFSLIEPLGINGETDFYDSGHLNFRGAAKMSEYIGGYLAENFLTRREISRAQKSFWNQSLEVYKEKIRE